MGEELDAEFEQELEEETGFDVHTFLALLADAELHRELIEQRLLPEACRAPLEEITKVLSKTDVSYPELVEKILKLEAEQVLKDRELEHEKRLRKQMQKERDEIHAKLKALRASPLSEETRTEVARLTEQWQEEQTE